MSNKLRPEITAALITELLGDVDRLLERSAEIGERLDTIAKRVDFEEGRILEAAKVLNTASAALEKSASLAVERNRNALATVLSEALGKYKSDIEQSVSGELSKFLPDVLASVDKRENLSVREINNIAGRLRKIEEKLSSRCAIVVPTLLALNLMALLVIVWRLFR